MAWDDAKARAALVAAFDTAVAAADPMRILAKHLPPKPRGRCVVVGAGKAAPGMAAALEAAWPDVPLEGAVVTRHGQGAVLPRIAVLEASHPVPDAASEVAARRMLDLVRGLGPDDLVLALISGGGSALLSLPAPGLTLADKQEINRQLLLSGATIGEMNAVRRHFSAIKGGRLAEAAGSAQLVTLALSDVPGDDPAIIASGPTVPDPSSWEDVRAIAIRRGLHLPYLGGAETPKPGAFPVDIRLIATPALALAAAAATAREHGATPLILGDAIEGEARELGTVLAGIATSARLHGHPATAPCMLLSGGETTVTIGAGPAGRGGRNMECLLALTIGLGGQPGIWALAADTDGIDGTEDAAGAIAGPGTLDRARAAGLDAVTTLAYHDSYSLFDALGDLVRTGPTGTNVNDFRAILIT